MFVIHIRIDIKLAYCNYVLQSSDTAVKCGPLEGIVAMAIELRDKVALALY